MSDEFEIKAREIVYLAWQERDKADLEERLVQLIAKALRERSEESEIS